MSRRDHGFTIIEIVTVIIIIVILSMFAIPNYIRTFERMDERNMIANLKSIRTAIDIYRNHGGTVGSWSGLSTINANLGLGITHPNMTYTCNGGSGCTAAHPAGWALNFNAGALIHCSAGTCPTCPSSSDCE